MTDSEHPHLDAEALAALRQLARSRPRSGRGQTARLGAIRVPERLERQEERRKPPDERTFPWDGHPELFAVYAPSEVEKALYGNLAGPHHWERSPEEWERIDAIVAELEASDDRPRAFRKWFVETASHATTAD